MTIRYDQQIEVTQKQYNDLRNECTGICAFREEEGKFFIKVLMMSYANLVRKVAGFPKRVKN